MAKKGNSWALYAPAGSLTTLGVYHTGRITGSHPALFTDLIDNAVVMTARQTVKLNFSGVPVLARNPGGGQSTTHRCAGMSGQFVGAVPLMKLETIILGAGPAGTGALVWAARNGLLGDWLDAGIAVVEQSESLGGTMGRYALNADTLGGTFLECLEGPSCEPELVALRRHPATIALARWRDRLPPLELAGRFLDKLGVALRAMFRRHPR